VRAVSADAFTPGPAGRLNPATLHRLDELIRLTMDL